MTTPLSVTPSREASHNLFSKKSALPIATKHGSGARFHQNLETIAGNPVLALCRLAVVWWGVNPKYQTVFVFSCVEQGRQHFSWNPGGLARGILRTCVLRTFPLSETGPSRKLDSVAATLFLSTPAIKLVTLPSVTPFLTPAMLPLAVLRTSRRSSSRGHLVSDCRQMSASVRGGARKQRVACACDQQRALRLRAPIRGPDHMDRGSGVRCQAFASACRGCPRLAALGLVCRSPVAACRSPLLSADDTDAVRFPNEM